METYPLPTVVEFVEEVEALPLTVAIGREGSRLIIEADPNDGSVTVSAEDRFVEASMSAEDFALVGALLMNALGA